MPRTVRVRPLPNGRRTPRHRGQGRAPARWICSATSGGDTTVTTRVSHSCRLASATTADVNSGHFVVQDANSVCPLSRRCRPKPAVGGWCSPTPRPLDMEISLIVVEMTPRSTGTDWASASPVTATPAVNGIWSGAPTPGWAAARSRTHEPGQTVSSPHGSDGTDPSPHRSVRRQVAAPRDLHPGSAKAGLSGRRRRCHPGGARRPEPSPQVDDRADKPEPDARGEPTVALAFTPDGPGPESGRGPSASPDRGLGR